jgi:S-adenosylmethionine decarboxylase
VPENGCLWVVDAFGCDPARLRSSADLEALFRAAVEELGLHPVRETVWQQFPAPGGLTGFLLLSESHLSIHTFPERGYAALDLYCCRPRPSWDWEGRLAEFLGATRVELRALERGARGR